MVGKTYFPKKKTSVQQGKPLSHMESLQLQKKLNHQWEKAVKQVEHQKQEEDKVAEKWSRVINTAMNK